MVVQALESVNPTGWSCRTLHQAWFRRGKGRQGEWRNFMGGFRQSLHLGAQSLVLGMLWVYRHCISPWKPACCRFEPTCSKYAFQAVARFGAGRGLWLALWRLLRCHPFYRGPLDDPVPQKSGDGDLVKEDK